MAESDRVLVESLRERLAGLEADAAALRKAIAVLEKGAPDRPASRSVRRRQGGPTITGLVMKLLADDPEKQWDARDLHDAMRAEGWDPQSGDPVNGVRTALARLADRKEIRRVGNGLYQALPPPESAGEVTPFTVVQ